MSYHARFPLSEFSFFEGMSSDQLAALRRHRVDVAFLVASDGASGVESEILWHERMFVALPENHALAGRASLTWAELRAETFVVRAFGSGPVIYAWLAHETIRMSGVFTPRGLEQHCFRCRWPAPDTSLRTMAGACRRAFASGFAAAGARRAWSTASAGAWRSAC